MNEPKNPDALYHRPGWKPKPCRVVQVHDDGTVDLADASGSVFVTGCTIHRTDPAPGESREGWASPLREGLKPPPHAAETPTAPAEPAPPAKPKRSRKKKAAPIEETTADPGDGVAEDGQ